MKGKVGGRRAGSGRKAGVTDGRVPLTVRVKKEVIERLGPRPARAIRSMVEGKGGKR
jgi:hypothetical protein